MYVSENYIAVMWKSDLFLLVVKLDWLVTYISVQDLY